MRTAIAAACLCLLSLRASAAAPSPESLERLLKAMDAEQTVQGVRQYGDAMLKGTLERVVQLRPMKPAQKAKLEATVRKLSAAMHDEMSWGAMKAMYGQVYAAQFSQEEIDAITVFYESAAGRAFLAKMPVVLEQSTALMQSRLDRLMQRMQAEIKETLEEK